MDLTPNYKIKDLVSIERQYGQRIATFPEILRDRYRMYHGILSISGKRIEDPMLAFLIDLIRWGYENLETPNRLKAALPNGEIPDTPEHTMLPPEAKKGLRALRPIRSFFEFEGDQRIQFYLPTLSIRPRGYVDMAINWKSYMTGFEAACIAAITTGWRIRNYDNPIPNFHVDDTSERVAFLRGRMSAPDFPAVMEDSEWQRRAWSSTISDYERRVHFARPLTGEQLDVYREYLTVDNCPGWTDIKVTRPEDNLATYLFSTTMDSSG